MDIYQHLTNLTSVAHSFFAILSVSFIMYVFWFQKKNSILDKLYFFIIGGTLLFFLLKLPCPVTEVFNFFKSKTNSPTLRDDAIETIVNQHILHRNTTTRRGDLQYDFTNDMSPQEMTELIQKRDRYMAINVMNTIVFFYYFFGGNYLKFTPLLSIWIIFMMHKNK